MKLLDIIYCCYGGAHSSPIGAAIHLQILDPHSIPSESEIMEVPFFDKVTPADRGKLMLMGTDSRGHRVYILGRGSEKKGMEEAIKSGLRLGAGRDDTIRFVDTLKCVNIWMRLGGFLSRELKLIKIGRPLVIYGTRKAFPCLVRVVNDTLAQLDGPSPEKEKPGT